MTFRRIFLPPTQSDDGGILNRKELNFSIIIQCNSWNTCSFDPIRFFVTVIKWKLLKFKAPSNAHIHECKLHINVLLSIGKKLVPVPKPEGF